MSNGNNKPSAVAWIALIIAVLAFILAWVAFNRAGEDIDDQIRQEVQDIIDNEQNGQEALDDADVDVEVNGTNVQQQHRREI